ncbi:MAG TPA: RNA polymerase subunit sigma [Planctomycetaceae bacterium]|nr:RNA polymerase subunit sigma [Planctomycetaceae bacterium]
MSDVTQVLNRIDAGEPGAADELLPLVYEQLRQLAAARMSHERSDHTLQATALVHEAYMRLVRGDGNSSWDGRGHFFAAAAESMRRILVEAARRKASKKRGGELRRVEFADFVNQTDITSENMLELNDMLEAFEKEDAEAAQLVKLRLFGGLSIADAGKAIGISRSTAYENWNFARAWFATNGHD